MFQIKPEKHWKFIKFEGSRPNEIDGEKYHYETFINSEKFIIHDVTTIIQLHDTNDSTPYARNYFHVWYERKGD